MSPSPTPLRTALADRYDLDRELGHGGMATVYLARDIRHDRLVALKVMRSELAAAIGTERFLREIQISARLNHPHVLGLYDSGEAGGFLFYVMPYVEGESLRDRLERDRQLPIDEALQIAREVADALSYAHSHDVVHRDIKPENILLASGHAVVADFGIARAITEAGGDRLTETGLSVGTPSYMSPEQAGGEKGLDGRSDVYALGCVLYEMLVGEPPHTGPTAQAIIARRLTEPVGSVRTVRETVAVPIDAALQRALARVPADRFATAAEFAAALQSPVPVAATTTRAVSGRNPVIPAAISTVVLVAIVVIVMLLARGNTIAPTANERPTLAVLPFENLGAPEDDYFADGLTEEMISRLAEISGLGVTSRTSTLRYRGTQRALQDIAAELNVRFILEGTVRTDRMPDGTGSVRVTPQLIRVSDDTHLWTDRYTAGLAPGEIFAIQAQIAERVAQALDVTLLGPEQTALRDVPTTSAAAHDAYLLGRFHWNKRGAENLVRAARYFERAIELDPEFAEAFTGLADTYALYGYYLVPDVPRAEAYTRAEAAARRAIALDSTLAAAHASLGNILTYGAWDWEAAEREFRRAIALDPDYAVARYWFAELLLIRGHFAEAKAQAESALASDPAAIVARHTLAVANLFEGRIEEAVAREREVLAFEPEFGFSRSTLGLILFTQGNYDAATDELVRAGAPREIPQAVARAIRDTTTRRQAVGVINRHERRLAAPGALTARPLVFAVWYLQAGAPDSALSRLEAAYDLRSEALIYSLRDPLFAPLRSHPRYLDLFRRLRLDPPGPH